MGDEHQTPAGADRFEKLGAFYLGRAHDLETGQTADDPVLYDARDLTTHAVCVGMTGSGKTGLCLAMLEEAALDGVPAIAIDPKGDIGNLLLTFPELRPEDFRPWIDEGAAARKGMSPDDFAAAQADLWRSGLAKWGQDGDRIRRLREAADLAIYTPGSSAGRPLAALRSLDAPPAELIADEEALRDRVMGTVSGLLALVGEDADPVRSPAHILLSTIIGGEWRAGRSLDLERLIGLIQAPPFDRVGVIDLDSFMPAKARTALAMGVNNLLASPGFAAWREGEKLDVQRLLWTPEGKPRVSVLSIAHLSEAQRMFFVTLVLNEVVAWMRAQSGTGSLRAIVYMDEVFGYFPPSAEPPSKRPLLTLMKQARAYGLGVVLATQNPVDLDYKGLSNAGTWLLGRLQTERDKRRVLEGLEGASASSFDKGAMERTLAALDSRVFLMHNVHEDAPVTFYTRWAMSYLRGPLTRDQIRTLCAPSDPGRPATGPEEPSGAPDENAAPAPKEHVASKVATPGAGRPGSQVVGNSGVAPVVGADVPVGFVAVTRAVREGEALVYRPALVGTAPLHYVRTSAGVDEWRDARLLAPLGPDGDADWENAIELDETGAALDDAPDTRGVFDDPPGEAGNTRAYASWRKDLVDHLYRHRALDVWTCKALKANSALGETEGDFRVRVRELAREKRDAELDEMRARYAPKLASAQERVRDAEQRVESEEEDARTSGLAAAASVGATILGALLGRKKLSSTNVRSAGVAAGRVSRTAKARGDIKRAEEDLAALKRKLADLDAEAERELERVRQTWDGDGLELESTTLAPRKTDMGSANVVFAWAPYRVGGSGRGEPAFHASGSSA
ncbi:MAG: hypothetical protein R3B49_10600 [Phycisphaerales bacterium]